jgi:hypothetical protein
LWWIAIITCILIGAILAYFLFAHIIIITTSICGSYLVVKGVSLYLGGLPDESYLIYLIEIGDFNTLWSLIATSQFIGYIAGWFVLFICGVVVQYCLRKKRKSKKRDDDEEDEMRFYLIRKK